MASDQGGSGIWGPVGGAAQAGWAKASSKLQWSRTKRMMKNRHQWEVGDLKAAGLNPMLSAGGAPSMGSPQQAQTPDLVRLGDQAITARQNIATRKKMTQERRVMESVIASNTALRGKYDAEARHSNQLGTIAMMGLPAAALKASIASSPSGQMAAKSGVWMEHVKAGAQVAGALALWMRRLGIMMPVGGMPGTRGGAAPKVMQPPPIENRNIKDILRKR